MLRDDDTLSRVERSRPTNLVVRTARWSIYFITGAAIFHIRGFSEMNKCSLFNQHMYTGIVMLAIYFQLVSV